MVRGAARGQLGLCGERARAEGMTWHDHYLPGCQSLCRQPPSRSPPPAVATPPPPMLAVVVVPM